MRYYNLKIELIEFNYSLINLFDIVYIVLQKNFPLAYKCLVCYQYE